jgi:hypothetical protein
VTLRRILVCLRLWVWICRAGEGRGWMTMSRAGRWLVAVVVTMAAFGVSLWVCGALLLPLWLTSGADRWPPVRATGASSERYHHAARARTAA